MLYTRKLACLTRVWHQGRSATRAGAPERADATGIVPMSDGILSTVIRESRNFDLDLYRVFKALQMSPCNIHRESTWFDFAIISTVSACRIIVAWSYNNVESTCSCSDYRTYVQPQKHNALRPMSMHS